MDNLPMTKVLLVDELDYLITKDQSVLYNLFEWPQRKNANLIVISVANTLDLPEKFLARISSRIGNTRLVFTPYNSGEIKEIIGQRVSETNLFDTEAVSFISKKIALVSSDIRKTLNICRQAVERFRKLLEEKKAKNEPTPQAISVQMVASIFDETYASNPLNLYIKKSNDLTKVLLSELWAQLNAHSSKMCNFSSLQNR